MVDKTMMGDKCAELVRAAMIGALAVTLGNPTAVYAAEEETADPGQIGIEIAGEAAVGAASFCVEEDAAEKAPAEAEEVTEPEGTQNDEMEEESGSEGKEDETVPEEPEPQEKFSMDLVNFRFSFSRFKIFIGTFLSFIKKKNSDPSCFFYYTGKKAKSTEKFRKKGNLEIMLSIFQRSDKIKFRKRKQYGQRRNLL